MTVVGALKYVRIIMGYNQIWEVDRVEPDEKSSYWWNKTELKRIRNEYREEVMMDGVRALVRTRLHLEEDDPAVIEDRLEQIMVLPPNLIAAFLESLPPPKEVAQDPKSSAAASLRKKDDDDSDSDADDDSSSSSSSSDSSGTTSSSSTAEDSDEEDDPVLRRQARDKKAEDTVSDDDIYALFGLDDEEVTTSTSTSSAIEDGGKKPLAVTQAATTTSNNDSSPPSPSRRKNKAASPVDEDNASSVDGDSDNDSSSSSSSDCDDSVSISLDGLNVKRPFKRRKQHRKAGRHHHHHHHRRQQTLNEPSSSSAITPEPKSPKKGGSSSRGRSSPTKGPSKADETVHLTTVDRKALVDLFKRAVLAVITVERLGGIIVARREAKRIVPPIYRMESHLIDLYLPSDEERDDVHHKRIARKRVNKVEKPAPGGGGDGGCVGGENDIDEDDDDDCSSHTMEDDNTECPICLGLVLPTQHRKITLLRRMLCGKCFSVHYTSRRMNPLPIADASPFNPTDKKSTGQMGLYRKDHNGAVSPKREAMKNRSLSPRREANRYDTSQQLGAAANRTKSLSPTRSHPNQGEEDAKPKSFVTRRGRRTQTSSTGIDANMKQPTERVKVPTNASAASPKTTTAVTPSRGGVRSMSPGRIRDSVDQHDIPVGKPASTSLLRVESNKPSSSVTRKGRRATTSSPTRTDRNETKPVAKVKVPSGNVGAMVPKTKGAAVPNRRVRSMSPSKIRDNIDMEDDVIVKPASMSSNIVGEERKPSSFVTRKGKRPTSKSPTASGAKTKKSAVKMGKVPTNVSSKPEAAPNRRVRSMSPGRVRDSVTPDASSNYNSKPKSTSVRKRGSSAEPTKTESASLTDDGPSKGRQTLRRGVRPKAVKPSAEKQEAKSFDDTNVLSSSSSSSSRSDHQAETAIEKKKRVKERLAKRRAQQRLVSAKAALVDSPDTHRSSAGGVGLASFLHQENTAHGLVFPFDDDYDDERTAQSAPL